MTDAQPLQFQLAATPADSAEDLARADLYGLLATLLYRAPDAGLLQRIAAAPLDPADAAAADPADAEAAAGSALTQAWRRLVARAGQTTAAQADDEYTELFIGVGKPEVFLYGSYYQAGFLNEKPLVVLRADLRRYGLERAEGITETEDHRHAVRGDALPDRRGGCRRGSRGGAAHILPAPPGAVGRVRLRCRAAASARRVLCRGGGAGEGVF